MENIKIHKGDVLVSSPLLTDPNFNRSVVLILDRDTDKGYIGLILNRQLDLTIQELLDIKNSKIETPVFNGGPVDLQRLFWLHTMGPDIIKGAAEVMPGIYIGGNFEDLQTYVENSGTKSEGHFRLYLGYSGWTKGQLEKEIEMGAWQVNGLVGPAGVMSGGGGTFG
ncbi:MAG: YqgE/AlgH family protein, partial [Muribaculaceae bacterium]|nr:YqgE/AlgH family protein [Muribaculaceae bacterium]